MIAYPMAAVWIEFERFGRSLVVLWQRLEESGENAQIPRLA